MNLQTQISWLLLPSDGTMMVANRDKTKILATCRTCNKSRWLTPGDLVTPCRCKGRDFYSRYTLHGEPVHLLKCPPKKITKIPEPEDEAAKDPL